MALELLLSTRFTPTHGRMMRKVKSTVTCTGWIIMPTLIPSVRAKAVARGPRPCLHPNCLVGVPGLSAAILARQQEKHAQWTQLVKICHERLSNASPDWKEDPFAADVDGDVDEDAWRRRRELLLWCQLFALLVVPLWTMRILMTTALMMMTTTTTTIPKPDHLIVNQRGLKNAIEQLLSDSCSILCSELLRIGSQLERCKTGFMQDGIKEIWDREIVPLVIG
jgi:hypothetical protein